MSKFTEEVIREQILKSYESFGFKPRGNQEGIIFSVLDEFLNKKKKTVVLGAATGIGKSILGVVVSDALGVLLNTEDRNSIISMGTNALARQYAESFGNQSKYKVFQIKGASNYGCAFMEAQLSAVSKTAEECAKKQLHPAEQEKYCNSCEYDQAKKTVNSTETLITNYSYFLTAQLISGHLMKRTLHTFDEAHTLNDIYCSFAEIVVDVPILEKYIKELSDVNGKCDNEAAALIVLKNRVSKKEVTQANYMQTLEVMQQIYKSAAKTLGVQSTLLEGQDVLASVKYAKLATKYGRSAGKIGDLFDNKYDHVFDDTSDTSFAVKPIFVGVQMEALLSDYNLLMSATITEQFCFDTLQLNRDTTTFIQTDPVFPPENKPIFFIGKVALNYNSMKDPVVIDELKTQVAKIVKFHDGQKGLILSPSFYLGSMLTYNLRGTKVFEHKSGINLTELISAFKLYKGSAVLVSPSIYEGLDFSGDDSRFQILVKSPFASLGDKRIKYIAENYPNIYRETTLIKLIQGAGRGVRSPEDYSVTYCLDASSQKLFDDRKNIWKNQFKIMSK